LQAPDGVLFGTQPFVRIVVSMAAAEAAENPPEPSTPTPSLILAAPAIASPVPVDTLFILNITPRAQEIFLEGEGMGNAPYAVSLVGDSITETGAFLRPFGERNYSLGDYWRLQVAVDRFGPSFVRDRLAAQGGFRAWNLLESMPDCGAETLVDCEYQTYHPSIAIIMIGTNDLTESNYGDVAGRLRQIVDITIANGVIPVLSTVPPSHGYDVTAYNGAVARIATEYEIPLIDYYTAMLDLPNDGLGEDGIHPSLPPDGDTATFDDEHLAYGYTLRNLTALQMLDALLRWVIY
jgi:lysophospholipase L1-like esterase